MWAQKQGPGGAPCVGAPWCCGPLCPACIGAWCGHCASVSNTAPPGPAASRHPAASATSEKCGTRRMRPHSKGGAGPPQFVRVRGSLSGDMPVGYVRAVSRSAIAVTVGRTTASERRRRTVVAIRVASNEAPGPQCARGHSVTLVRGDGHAGWASSAPGGRQRSTREDAARRARGLTCARRPGRIPQGRARAVAVLRPRTRSQVMNEGAVCS